MKRQFKNHTNQRLKNSKEKVYAKFKDNIWARDLDEKGSLSPKNRAAKQLLCLIDIFTKIFWVKILTDKKSKTVLNGFIGIESESKLEPNNLQVNEGREFSGQIIRIFQFT